ncbi:TPA: cold-shock protein, partial [Klebsiella pneumoniae]|nr:cold-shock protein [Klebsiella pneumoniae]
MELLKFPFPRIYTFNIDDAFERSAYQQNKFKFNVRRRNSIIEDFDMLYSSIDLIKLNGDINQPDDGFIFSQAEYGEGSASEPRWYTELARDFHRFTFLFIGTKLKEPLFQHQVEKFKSRTYEQNSKSYLLTPSLSSAQQGKFLGSNIDYIQGTLNDFVKWLRIEFPNHISADEILKRTRPEMNLVSSQGIINPTFERVTAVSRALLSLIDDDNSISDIKSFYKGFKPT